ncbi:MULTISPECIES: DUF5058 family protein [Cetobacterium]|uniref:DUF5058 family protein n=1 Tax=Candidatus Cetobacterium colombiensis TaxID=3073100 RepID=A0ABU4WB76_9FUSO|nr:DUF5058 family protein [Candidatus Cetobacterium colombiensis]MDX8335650.1 DUF5058 family protein [Candidatus Cetobacterium colombiensis]
MNNHMIYASHPIIWGTAILGIIIVLLQSGLIIKKSIAAAKDLRISNEQISKGIKVSAMASIGPALGVVGSLLALLVTMGSPVSTLRLSLIGSSNFEAMAANFGAQAMGSELSTNMLPVVFTNALWTMALGSMGWIIFVFLFAHKMDKVNGLLTNGRKALLPAVGLGAMLGSFAFFNVGNLMKFKTNPDVTVAAISGMIIMVICLKIGEKMPWLKEWALTFAMFGGAAIGLLAL